MLNFDINSVPTPCYVVDEKLITRNLEILADVRRRAGCKILLAQKAFSMYSMYPLISRYLDGTTASSLHEAMLGREEMQGEVHIFSPAYMDAEFDMVTSICDHIVFNSFTQWRKFRERVKSADRHMSCGIRINPEYSEQEHEIYDPCAAGSRLGVTIDNFKPEELDGIEGLHFHTMCEQNSDTLERTLEAVQAKFGKYLHQMKWLNFGGGHHITRDDYDIDRLISCITRIKEKYGVDVYLEPGEAVALNAGFLITEVLDIIDNGITAVILDASAACHMPDVIEMPYRPNIIGAGKPFEYEYTYRFGGNTCLAGDILGDYSFAQPLQIGSRLVLCDMAIYSMVKNNTFNGINLPSIAICHANGEIEIVKQFGYQDFKRRL